MGCALPGRRLHRHPGLAPGTNKKAVISKQPPLAVFKIPDIAARFRDDPITVIPGLLRELTKRPQCKNNPRWTTQKVLNPIPNNEL